MSERTDSFVAALKGHLTKFRFVFADEAGLVAQLKEAMQAGGFKYENEKALRAQDRPDFLVEWPEGLPIALEVKVKASIGANLRQMRRYCAHKDKVSAVVLVCVRTQPIPETLNELPVYAIQLWRNIQM